MNEIELNAILFYADFLSLKERSYPVTDNCKYFYIHGVPINACFILNLEPVYDTEDSYFKLAETEYLLIKDKYGDEGVESFIDDICAIRACGTVDAERMLRRIHQYSSKHERKLAFGSYYTWKNSQIYTHSTINELGKPIEKQCSSYVYHVERMLNKRGLLKDIGTHVTA